MAQGGEGVVDAGAGARNGLREGGGRQRETKGSYLKKTNTLSGCANVGAAGQDAVAWVKERSLTAAVTIYIVPRILLSIRARMPVRSRR